MEPPYQLNLRNCFYHLQKLYLVYIRPRLEYNTQVWSLYLKKDVNLLESVQRRYIRIIFNRCNIPNTSYTDRLIKLKTKSFMYRRLEFDLITLFELVNGETTIEFNDIFYFYEKLFF